MESVSGAGEFMGIAFTVNISYDNYMSPTRSFPGVEIMVHRPTDFPDVLVATTVVAPGEDARIAVDPEVIKSETSIRNMDADQRACWFNDEIELVIAAAYSFESCMVECRASYTIRLCGCLPFFFPVHRK